MRADEHEPGTLDLFREIRVLGEKAVARMDRLGVGHLSGADDRRYVQIARGRGRRADAYGFVGELDVFSLGVGLGVNHYGSDAELAAGALNAQRNLAAVGDQDLFKHLSR